jgi:hypothetical protein
MLVLALLIGQALGLPEVEGPIPDKVGLDLLLSFAGVGGMFGGFLSLIWPQKRDLFISLGTLAGFGFGGALYALLMLVQLLSGL